MAGICNGFQALIKLGLVPYGKIIDTDENCPTLTFNTIGRHLSQMVETRISSVKSPWLAKVNVNDRMATVEASVTKNTSDINTLNGGKDVVGSVQYTVAQRVAEIIDEAPESFDTLKELAAWINTHGADAAGMQESITTTKTDRQTYLESLGI